ncbi:TetR/AcrR family transcriptional regulator [Nocardia crassostreae]|uniref:TetR/AcrR family transcriptional regulator n=1 Tax=Nocardia crassostreae TaxID=53428 RepID=UPI001FDFC5CE|nr:TetR/AcrR family transcriptional regulator C-terminal domain-containing protein [Nocardia crassostreae]
MSRIAKELGFTTMSLYRYVDSKDTLAELLLDHVCGLPPELPAAGWREGLEAWAWAEFRMIRARDWWLDIPRSGPPMGPNNMAWLEAGMTAMTDAPIPEGLKLQLIMNLSMYVIGRADFLRTLAASADDTDFTAILAQVMDPERFPALTRAITNRAFEDDDINWEEGDFRFGLDRLRDGYEHFIRTMTP